MSDVSGLRLVISAEDFICSFLIRLAKEKNVEPSLLLGNHIEL